MGNNCSCFDEMIRNVAVRKWNVKGEKSSPVVNEDVVHHSTQLAPEVICSGRLVNGVVDD